MVIKKEELIKESLRYLNESKRQYSHADAIAYNHKIAKVGIRKEFKRSWFKMSFNNDLFIYSPERSLSLKEMYVYGASLKIPFIVVFDGRGFCIKCLKSDVPKVEGGF